MERSLKFPTPPKAPQTYTILLVGALGEREPPDEEFHMFEDAAIPTMYSSSTCPSGKKYEEGMKWIQAIEDSLNRDDRNFSMGDFIRLCPSALLNRGKYTIWEKDSEVSFAPDAIDVLVICPNYNQMALDIYCTRQQTGGHRELRVSDSRVRIPLSHTTTVAIRLGTSFHGVIHEFCYIIYIIQVKMSEMERFGVGSWTTSEVWSTSSGVVAEEGPGSGRLEEIAFSVFFCSE
ncbi:hypothetical protein BDR06DRAFT_977860, partial [Suillus hirtellus]